MSYIPPRHLPDQITIEHGPAPLLARFFALADETARARGVALSLRGDFADLVALNRRERAHWYPLLSLFNPDLSRLRLDDAFWIEGRNEAGETVVAQAARLFRWAGTTLADEVASRRMVYAEPARDSLAGESWRITAPAASRIAGRVLYSGSTWFRPDYRGRGLSRILPRVSRAYGFTRWRTDYTISMVEAELIERGVVRSYGYKRIEPMVEARNTRLGDLDNALIWMDSGELVDDLAGFTASLDNGGALQHRHAGHDAVACG